MCFTGHQFEPHWAVVANLNGSIFLDIVDIGGGAIRLGETQASPELEN